MKNLQSVKLKYGIIGHSDKLNNALSTAIRVANTDLSVLITGESGVGKEVFSKIIHSLSPRKHNKSIAINCGAIPAGTINSELFGHEKGSFTGATADRKGYFETVDGGTIFLDEIGEMPLDTQAFLLRILESGEFIKVGSSKTLKTNVRVIAATNVALTDKIKQGKFREDLYYRLNTVPIRVPPLRERSNDILMLFRKFSVDFAEKYRTTPIQLTESARSIIRNYAWPGNIRELKNLVEQLSVLAEEKLVDESYLLELMPHLGNRNLPAISNNRGHSEKFEEREIMYKLLFDMKSDLTDLKSLIFELVKTNDLNMPEAALYSGIRSNNQFGQLDRPKREEIDVYQDRNSIQNNQQDIPNQPIFIDDEFENAQIVEDNLSIEDMEKDLIQRALKKHRGKRKDAATDLGISERTLYRKIKQYGL